MPYPYEKSNNPIVRKLEECGCYQCLKKADSIEPLYGDLNWIQNRTNSHMVACNTCGNKRCPHASTHVYCCTNSNEPDQIPTMLPHEIIKKMESGEIPTTLPNKKEVEIEEHVSKIPIEELRRLYILSLKDWANDDDQVKEIASQVLSKDELEDAPFYDRFIGVIDIVEMLVEKIKKLQNET